MPQLQDDHLDSLWDSTKEKYQKIRQALSPLFKLVDLINHRFSRIIIFRVPLMHLINVLIFVSLLVKYIPRYSKFYAITRLPATLAMNLLLFGLADCLAQTLTRLFSKSHAGSPTQNLRNSPGLTPYSDDAQEDRFQIFVDYGDDDEYEHSAAPASGHVLAHAQDNDIQSLVSNENGIENDLPMSHHKIPVFDYFRLGGFMMWGFFISFPQFFWYMILNGLYVDDPKFITVLERVLADQLFYSPLSLALFLYYSSIVLEQGDKYTFEKKIKKIYISTLAANYCLWPAVQFINFLAMPKAYQVPFSSSIGVLWNCFLSMRNAQAKS